MVLDLVISAARGLGLTDIDHQQPDRLRAGRLQLPRSSSRRAPELHRSEAGTPPMFQQSPGATVAAICLTQGISKERATFSQKWG